LYTVGIGNPIHSLTAFHAVLKANQRRNSARGVA